MLYRSAPLFPYAEGYYGVFPRGLEDRYNGVGTLVIEEGYLLYFKPDTPQDLNQRLCRIL